MVPKNTVLLLFYIQITINLLQLYKLKLLYLPTSPHLIKTKTTTIRFLCSGHQLLSHLIFVTYKMKKRRTL